MFPKSSAAPATPRRPTTSWSSGPRISGVGGTTSSAGLSTTRLASSISGAICPTDSPARRGLETLHQRGKTVEVLSPTQVRQRFPQFAVQDDDTLFYDPWSGYLRSGQAVADLADLARDQGVAIRSHTPVQAMDETDRGVRLVTGEERPLFDRVVVAAGAWVVRLFPTLKDHLRITRQQMAFLVPDRSRKVRSEGVSRVDGAEFAGGLVRLPAAARRVRQNRRGQQSGARRARGRPRTQPRLPRSGPCLCRPALARAGRGPTWWGGAPACTPIRPTTTSSSTGPRRRGGFSSLAVAAATALNSAAPLGQL